jgi:tetratricopeptide (TPR) repeat protein
MLQIALRAILAVLTAGMTLAAAGTIRSGDDSLRVEWLLQCADSEEPVALSQVAVTLPADVRSALKHYADGEYRRAAENLEKLRSLSLPDGRMDFLVFALGESYRRLGCRGLAARDYRTIIDDYPGSDNVPASCYRLLEFAVANDEPGVDSLYASFCRNFAAHPLINAVRYVGALHDYGHGEYAAALEKLAQIPATSSVLPRTRFLSALCRIQTREFGEALETLTDLRKSGGSGELLYETSILIGDIYYLQNTPAEALKFYRKVPSKAKRFKYAQVKIAQCYFDMGNYKKSAKLALLFLEKNPANSYYFEIASVLEESYGRLGDKANAALVGRLIRQEIVNARLTFEIFDEVDRIADMLSSWQDIEHLAIRDGRESLEEDVNSNSRQLQDLESRYYDLLKEVAPEGAPGNGPEGTPGSGVPYQAERRYLGMLKTRKNLFDDSISDLQGRILASGVLVPPVTSDTVVVPKTAAETMRLALDSLKHRREQCDHEYAIVMKECIGKEYKNREGDEELQAKFIDWVFAKYQETKEELKRASEQIAARRKAAVKAEEAKKTPEATSPGNPVKAAEPAKTAEAAPVPLSDKAKQGGAVPEKVYTEADRDRLVEMIANDREGLISHLRTSLDVYPKSKYCAKILFRLAELYFDEAGDQFQAALAAYEQKMAQGKDTAGLAFPEYHLEKVVATYNDIITQYPGDEVVEGAYFYKALAMEKWGRDDTANTVLQELIEKFPQSQYFVEANMRIGKYYFDHPKSENGHGYTLASDAYRRVLLFRDHPQYYAALYQLGWCYYMQNQYEDAIAVFKYLIEGSHPDFNLAKREENQVKNPLLREEAVDYIAVCYDLLGKMDDAIGFLKLTNSPDYSAMVVKRIGELREEDLDYPGAIRVYKRLLNEYPESRDAPTSSVSLIRLYDSHKNTDSAMLLREDFTARYGKGGAWQKQFGGDSTLLKSVDSMSIANGLYVADATYRQADSTKDAVKYEHAAKNYERLVETYPQDPHAAEALWNLAVIQDTKLHDKEQAFARYTAYSKLPSVDSTRREQAALNAFAISQELLPADSLVKKGEIDLAAMRVINAVLNYCTLFPHGSSWSKVMLGLGAVYFNRHLLADAEKSYEAIVAHGQGGPEYFEALLFLGQCRYAEDNWGAASEAFEQVWKSSGDETLRAAAKKLLLQSEFLNAKKIDSTGNAEQAAELYRLIDEQFPGSEYGDVVLFNAAEAMEKLSKWDKACERYADLVTRYPQSKLAAGALFNSAGDYEKIGKFDLAAQAYERIIAVYPASDKAKDALFNVGFCYEKLGKPEKMAEVNERYSEMYPGEKNVELMLLRSGAYYVKAGLIDKAIEAYRTFISRYSKLPQAVEASYMLAKCYYDKGYFGNALIGFAQTEALNTELSRENLATDNFHAAEAAYYSGLIKRETFLALKFTGTGEDLLRIMREKSGLMADAEASFRRVMEYRSPRIFEAANYIGRLSEELAMAWKNQARPPLDPIKAALLDKDILTVSSALLQKSFIPYGKVRSIAKAFDSLAADQKQWIAKSDSALRTNIIEAGAWLWEAAGVMQAAPVPLAIREKPVHYYQYQKRLLETVLPLKRAACDYYVGALSLADSLVLTGREIDSCRSMFAKDNYSIGLDYDSMYAEIVARAKDLSGDLTKAEKEDIVFQLQDISYEMQDKAIQYYEEGLANVRKNNLESSPWSRRILESLARLDPTKYGRAFYQPVAVVSDSGWLVRADSAAGWKAATPPQEGWQRALALAPCPGKDFAPVHALYLGSATPAGPVYFRRNAFLSGAPRSADVRVMTQAPYRLYVNGLLILSDTVGKPMPPILPDSAIGIASTLKGGDNWIAFEVNARDSAARGAAMALSVMIDTSQHFVSASGTAPAAPVQPLQPKTPDTVSAVVHPVMPVTANPAFPSQPAAPVLKETPAAPNTAPAAAAPAASTAPAAAPAPSVEPPAPPVAAPVPPPPPLTPAETYHAIENYKQREATADEGIEKEQFEISKLKAEQDSLDAQLNAVKNK